ncbi:hypothetical protein NIES298_40280 [Microcystis aeruginosa NIES-298]|nr:hypothetical protein NIES298_40280 [Microcystis aeruginosa NIES-298]
MLKVVRYPPYQGGRGDPPTYRHPPYQGGQGGSEAKSIFNLIITTYLIAKITDNRSSLSISPWSGCYS